MLTGWLAFPSGFTGVHVTFVIFWMALPRPVAETLRLSGNRWGIMRLD